jgi:hypothetical protein
MVAVLYRGMVLEGGECQNGDHLGEQDDAKPVSSTATTAALNAIQQVCHAQVESFPPDSRLVSGRVHLDRKKTPPSGTILVGASYSQPCALR